MSLATAALPTRADRRVPFSIPAHILHARGGKSLVTRTLNISRHGILLRCDARRFAPKELVITQLVVGDDEVILLTGRVTRASHDEGLAALQLFANEPEHQRRWEAFVLDVIRVTQPPGAVIYRPNLARLIRFIEQDLPSARAVVTIGRALRPGEPIQLIVSHPLGEERMALPALPVRNVNEHEVELDLSEISPAMREELRAFTDRGVLPTLAESALKQLHLWLDAAHNTP